MKTPWISYTLAVASALCLAGCGAKDDSALSPLKGKYFKKSMTTLIYSIEIEGHEYIIFNGTYKGNIIHSESCPCRKGGAE